MKSGTFVFALALLASGSLFASVTEEETFSYQLDDGGTFSISNVNGSINITGGSGNGVEIVATKKAMVHGFDGSKEVSGADVQIIFLTPNIVFSDRASITSLCHNHSPCRCRAARTPACSVHGHPEELEQRAPRPRRQNPEHAVLVGRAPRTNQAASDLH